MLWLQYIFWACLALVVYAYVGYPILVWLLARVFRRPFATGAGSLDETIELPQVSLLIAAHNEEACIAERLENALAMDYPAERLEIVVASDGSRDRTCEIVRRFEGDASGNRVKLLDYEQNRGKATTLNDAMAETSGELVVFSDANTMFEKEALRNLIAPFADPQVGAVCGKLVLHDPETGKNVDGLYWRYETFLKRCEGRLGALLGANGAIYALRRELFVPIPGNTIIDDFTIPLLAKLRHGCRIVYEESAVANEESAPSIQAEFRRRARIGTGGYQSIVLLWRLLSPRHGWTAFTFFSHKVLRWLVPFLLPVILLANLALLSERLYQILFAAQVAFYAMALVGSWLPGNRLPAKLARVSGMFCSMNAALLVGFYRWAFVPQKGTWKRTSREGAIGGSR